MRSSQRLRSRATIVFGFQRERTNRFFIERLALGKQALERLRIKNGFECSEQFCASALCVWAPPRCARVAEQARRRRVALLVKREFDKGVTELTEALPTCATAGFEELCQRHAGLGTATLPGENSRVGAQRQLKSTTAPTTLGGDLLSAATQRIVETTQRELGDERVSREEDHGIHQPSRSCEDEAGFGHRKCFVVTLLRDMHQGFRKKTPHLRASWPRFRRKRIHFRLGR